MDRDVVFARIIKAIRECHWVELSDSCTILIEHMEQTGFAPRVQPSDLADLLSVVRDYADNEDEPHDR